jgi:hypothetical protein
MPRTEEKMPLDDPLDSLAKNTGPRGRVQNLNANLIALSCAIATFRAALPLKSSKWAAVVPSAGMRR